MSKLLSLLHDVIGYAAPAGNIRADLHQAAEDAATDLAETIVKMVEHAVEAKLGDVSRETAPADPKAPVVVASENVAAKG
jgi:hypothetical protein